MLRPQSLQTVPLLVFQKAPRGNKLQRPIVSCCRPSEHEHYRTDVCRSVENVARNFTNKPLIDTPGMCALPDASLKKRKKTTSWIGKKHQRKGWIDGRVSAGHRLASCGVGPINGPNRTGGYDSHSRNITVAHSSKESMMYWMRKRRRKRLGKVSCDVRAVLIQGERTPGVGRLGDCSASTGSRKGTHHPLQPPQPRRARRSCRARSASLKPA